MATESMGTSTCGAGMLDVTAAIASVTPRYATSLTAGADCVFNWAERTYPEYFAPAGTASATFAPYYYRHYPESGNFLATI